MADLMKKKHQLRLIELEESVLVAQVTNMSIDRSLDHWISSSRKKLPKKNKSLSWINEIVLSWKKNNVVEPLLISREKILMIISLKWMKSSIDYSTEDKRNIKREGERERETRQHISDYFVVVVFFDGKIHLSSVSQYPKRCRFHKMSRSTLKLSMSMPMYHSSSK